MKKIEELLNIDLGRKFDTPKKLNRSTSQVPRTRQGSKHNTSRM